MSLGEQVKVDLEQAVRQRDSIRCSALRLLLSAIHNAEIDQQHKKLDESEIISIIAKEIKKRRESIDAFEKGNRPDLVDKEKTELDILSRYMPQQLSREEITIAVKNIINSVGAKGSNDKGKVMGQLMPLLKGKADGKEINDIVTELLINL